MLYSLHSVPSDSGKDDKWSKWTHQKPLVQRGLNVSCLVCLRDGRHYGYADSVLASAEVELHDEPVYFNCYPDRMIDLKDIHILDALKLNIKLNGLNMKPGSIPVTLIYRI